MDGEHVGLIGKVLHGSIQDAVGKTIGGASPQAEGVAGKTAGKIWNTGGGMKVIMRDRPGDWKFRPTKYHAAGQGRRLVCGTTGA